MGGAGPGSQTSRPGRTPPAALSGRKRVGLRRAQRWPTQPRSPCAGDFPVNVRMNPRRRHPSHVDRTAPSGRPAKSSGDARLHLLDSRSIRPRKCALRLRVRADSDLISPAIPTYATPGHSLGMGVTQWAGVDRASGPTPRAPYPYQPRKPSAARRPPGRVDGQHHRPPMRVPPVHHRRSHVRRVRSLRPPLHPWDDPAAYRRGLQRLLREIC